LHRSTASGFRSTRVADVEREERALAIRGGGGGGQGGVEHGVERASHQLRDQIRARVVRAGRLALEAGRQEELGAIDVRLEVEEALVDAAQLLDIERAVVDALRNAGRLIRRGHGQVVDGVEEVHVGDAGALEVGGVAAGKEMPVQWRHVERVAQVLGLEEPERALEREPAVVVRSGRAPARLRQPAQAGDAVVFAVHRMGGDEPALLRDEQKQEAVHDVK
jgi:hypothetical protein